MIYRVGTLTGLIFAVSLAGCSHGSSTANTMPMTAQSNQQSTAAVQVSTNVLAVAPAGVRVYVHLPLRNSAQLDELIREQSTKGSALYQHWLTPAQFRETYGPTPQNLASAATYLQAQGFKTTITSQGIVADAPQQTVERAFGLHLSTRASPLAVYRGGSMVSTLSADRAPTIPTQLAALGAHVAAYAPITPLQPQGAVITAKPVVKPQNRYGPYGGYWFDDLRQAYEYPARWVAHGSGETIAIFTVSNYLPSDMSSYFGFEGVPVPEIAIRPVDGGPQPFNPTSSFGYSQEVTYDIQQAGGSAPGAKLVLYGVPDSSITPSTLDAYTAIVEDDIADVAVSSYGVSCELAFIAADNGGFDLTYLFQDFHDIFRQGNAEGITFLNSSGDDGALGCVSTSGGTLYSVGWPANDPDVTAVGGTNLETAFDPPSLSSTYVAENGYDDPLDPALVGYSGAVWGSGGGKSVYWSKPFYQYLVNTGASTRTVPDIAMHMGGCPSDAVQPCAAARSYDIAAFNGAFYGFIGTSGSVQEFAGLQAIQDEILHSRTGNVNYLIYALAAFHSLGHGPIFHDAIPGGNGYPSHPGYNWVVGNGTPYAAQYAVDPFGPFAGDPQTPSNP